MQEIKPTVPSSRGGYGWPIWTGPRRRSFEAYCTRSRLSAASDQANYGFLFSELKGAYRGAIAKLQAAKGLANKVKAFELAYKQAGKKNYASRNRWASIALDAWHTNNDLPTLPAWARPAAAEPAGPAVKPAPAPPPVVWKSLSWPIPARCTSR
nr:phage tail tip lysozyme [Mesorhizobium sp. AR07]